MLISELSVRRPVFAVVVSMLLAVIGLIAAMQLPVREYPNVDSPTVSVSVRYRGASADVVETKITRVVENELAGIEGLDKLSSISEDERAQIRLEFATGIDIESAANDVRDRISRVQSRLPLEAEAPQISKVDTRADQVVIISLKSDSRNPSELTDYANRYIVDRLAVVPGVAQVQLLGAQKFAMRVWLDRRALAARGLTVQDIEMALRSENVELPAGRIESELREFTLRTNTGMRTENDFRNLVLGKGRDGYLIRLGEVANVALEAEERRSLSRAQGGVDVGLSVIPTSTANVLQVADDVRAAVASLQSELPTDLSLTLAVDNSTFVHESIKEVIVTLIIALLLVLAIIYLFLGTVRATLIPAVTIPVSVVAACSVMAALGFSFNVLTLLGAVLAIGLVVDDAIVVLENIVRRIEEGERPLIAAVDGSKEIGFAVVATTLALMAVFLPISFLPGSIGKLFREFGITVAAAVFFSCAVALTLTPMMASKLFAAGIVRGRMVQAVDGAFQWLNGAYRRSLRAVLQHAWTMAVLSVVVCAGGYLVLRQLPSEYTPIEDRGSISINVTAPEGSSIQYIDYRLRPVELVANRELENGIANRAVVRVGAGSSSGGGGAVNTGRIIMALKDWDERSESAQQVAARLRKQLSDLPGVRVTVSTPTGLGGRSGGQPVQFVLNGPSYEKLSEWRDIVMARARENPGLTGIESDFNERKPRIEVSIDRNRAADLGVSLETVGRTLETLLGSRVVTTFVEQGEEYNVLLQARTEDRATPADLHNIYVRAEGSAMLVPLSNLVYWDEKAAPAELNRFDRMRSITISAGLAEGYSLGAALEFLTNVVRTELPPEAKINYNGQSREFLRSGNGLYFAFVLAVGIVYLLLAAQFESFRHPAIIITTVPLAMAGAVLGLWWQGGSINIYSQIGAVMLIGLATKNGILIVEFANQLRDRGIEFADAIVQASVTRLRPVLMTSLCAVFGAVPLMVASGAGAESRQSIGAVIVFGVTFSLVLTLYVVPAMYALIARNTRSPEHVSRLLDEMRGAKQEA